MWSKVKHFAGQFLEMRSLPIPVPDLPVAADTCQQPVAPLLDAKFDAWWPYPLPERGHKYALKARIQQVLEDEWGCLGG